MRSYFSLVAAILYVTNGITSVVINVGFYRTNVVTCVTCSVTVACVNVFCHVFSFLTYVALEPVMACACGVSIIVGMLIYSTLVATLVTSGITGVAVNVECLFLYCMTYLALIPMLIIGKLKLICMLYLTCAATYVTISIASVIVNVIGYYADSVTNITGGITIAGIAVCCLVLLIAANGTLIPVLVSILVHSGRVCMLYLTLYTTVITCIVTLVVIGVKILVKDVTATDTLIPVVGSVAISGHINVLGLALIVANVTGSITRVIKGVSYFTLSATRVTYGIASVIVNVSAYLTNRAADVTIGIADVEEYVMNLIASLFTYVTGRITRVVVGVSDGASLTAYVTISITAVCVCMRSYVATLILVVTRRLVPMALGVKGPLV